MKLYEITAELQKELIQLETAQTDDDLLLIDKNITSIEMAFSDKVLAIGYVVRNLEADTTAIESELNRLEYLKKRAVSQKEWLLRYLKGHMELAGIPEVRSATLSAIIRKNPPSVIIDNAANIPEKYQRVIPERREPDKKAILEAWKKDKLGVDGTHIEETNTRVEIK
jgi:hypothetical protein